MFKDLSIISEVDAFFKIHPFTKTVGRLPFTMIGCERRNKKSDYVLFLNHDFKKIYKVIQGKVTKFAWPNHVLYFVAGVDGVYTVVHRNLNAETIRVPCCYGNPDYLVSGTDPNIKLLAIIDYLGWDWVEISAPCEESAEIMALVNEKIKTKGWCGGAAVIV